MRKRIIELACAIGVSVAAICTSVAGMALPSIAQSVGQTDREWMKDVTALVIAPDGTWGTATEPSTNQALASAIARCKHKHGEKIGCGYRSTFIREGWSLALRCGRENIIVAEKILSAAEQAAVNAELRLRRDYKPDMLPCVRTVSVSPDGAVIAPDARDLLRFVMDRRQ